MTSLDELLRLHGGLTTVHVERWVARGLLRPRDSGESWSFEQVDVARARLLAELGDDIGFDDDTVETVVALVDQVHTLRGQLGLLARAIAEQPRGYPRGDRGGAAEIAPGLALQRLPDLLGRERHVEMAHAERRQRIEHGVGDRRRRAVGRQLADALEAQEIVGRGRGDGLDGEVGHVVGARQGVVHQGAGQELAGLLVV